MSSSTGAALQDVWFESCGTKLFAVEKGGGQPIVFLHGGLANHLASLSVIGSLAARRVIAPDVRGSGKSKYWGSLEWEQLASDVDALMRHLGVKRAVVGGVSTGTGIALRFALSHPEKVAGLVLVTPVYGGKVFGLTAHQTAAFGAMNALGSRAVNEGIEALHPLFMNLPSPVRERALAVVGGFDPASVAATTAFLASGAQPFATQEELQSISAPALLIPGADALHPSEVSDIYAANIPNCMLVERQCADVARVIDGFCEGVMR